MTPSPERVLDLLCIYLTCFVILTTIHFIATIAAVVVSIANVVFINTEPSVASKLELTTGGHR